MGAPLELIGPTEGTQAKSPRSWGLTGEVADSIRQLITDGETARNNAHNQALGMAKAQMLSLIPSKEERPAKWTLNPDRMEIIEILD